MKTLIIATILLSLTPQHSTGSKSELVRKINEIKARSDIYYWNQYTHAVADSAMINASRWMLVDINTARSEYSQLTLEQITPYIRYVKISRGANTQYFAYLKKADLSLAASPATVPGTQVGTRRVASDSPSPATGQTTSPYTPTQSQSSFVPDAFVQKIREYKDFYAVYKFLKSQKAQKQLLQFGALKDVEDYSSMDLILFDIKSKELVAILSATNPDGTRTNLITGTPDSLDNYPEDLVLVIWYIK